MKRSFQSPPAEMSLAPAVRPRVMAAAADLFASRGFAGTSISEIRKASGASASSIYWEFGSKEGILRAVLEDSADRWLKQAGEFDRRAWEEAEVSGRPGLELCFANLAASLTERPEFLRLLLLLALERRDTEPETLDVIRAVRARATSGFAQGFRTAGLLGDGVPDDVVHEIATATMAFADGAFVAAQIDPGVADLRRLFFIFYSGLVAALQLEGGSNVSLVMSSSQGGAR